MRTIICKKCGATIDATLGECPNCGAVYYILPEDGGVPDAPAQDTAMPRRDPFESAQDLNITKASNDDIFNTSVWNTVQDRDETRAFRTVQPQQKERRQAATQPARREPRRAPAETQGRGGRPSKKKDGNNKKRRLIVAGVALLAILTLVISIMSGVFDFNKSTDKQFMPDIVASKYTIETATNILEGMGLTVLTQNEHDASPAGTVIAQSIKVGKVVKEGDKVTLTVSLGPDENTSGEPLAEVSVPYLIDKTYDQAVYELGNLGLLVQKGEDQYSDKPAGRVISQNPSQGSIVREGDMVLIIVSKGIEPSPSPTGYTISVTAGSGGNVSPKGLVTVEENGEITFTITPSEGYEVREVKVDGTDVGAVTSYKFTNVTKDHTLYVVFKVKSEPTPTPTPTPTPSPSQQPPDPTLPVD